MLVHQRVVIWFTNCLYIPWVRPLQDIFPWEILADLACCSAQLSHIGTGHFIAEPPKKNGGGALFEVCWWSKNTTVRYCYRYTINIHKPDSYWRQMWPTSRYLGHHRQKRSDSTDSTDSTPHCTAPLSRQASPKPCQERAIRWTNAMAEEDPSWLRSGPLMRF